MLGDIEIPNQAAESRRGRFTDDEKLLRVDSQKHPASESISFSLPGRLKGIRLPARSSGGNMNPKGELGRRSRVKQSRQFRHRFDMFTSSESP